MKKINVGIIGYGYAASTFHIPLLLSNTDYSLTAISTSKQISGSLSKENINVFRDATDLISCNDISLVVITAPNVYHYSLAKQCLNAGKHVVLEKPMTVSVVEAQSLVELAHQKSLLLSVFHNRRWDGDFLTVKSLISEGKLGSIRYFESHYDRFRPHVRSRWREESMPGSGIWFDLGSHLVDQAICLFGKPLAVTASCRQLRDGSKTTDYFHVTLHYTNHEAILHASSFNSAKPLRFHVEGTKATYRQYSFDPQEQQLREGLLPTNINFGKYDESAHGELSSENGTCLVPTKDGNYQSFYLALAESLKNRCNNLPVPATEIISTLQILEIAEKSHLNRRTIDFKQL